MLQKYRTEGLVEYLRSLPALVRSNMKMLDPISQEPQSEPSIFAFLTSSTDTFFKAAISAMMAVFSMGLDRLALLMNQRYKEVFIVTSL
jgi:hypothetical protein